MEIDSVRSRKTFVQAGFTVWEQLIKDRLRTTVPLSNIEDPVERNNRMNSAKRTRKWRTNNPEKARESVKRWKQKPENAKKIKDAAKKWRNDNPDKVKIYQERNKKNVKAWAEAHPERVKELNRKSDRKRAKSPKRKAWVKDYLKRPEVKKRRSEYEHNRNQDPERKAQNKASKERQKIRKKGAALFALLCNIQPIRNSKIK